MSNLTHDQILEDARAEVAELLTKKEYTKVQTIVEGLADAGFLRESEILGKMLDDASDFKFEPYEETNIPLITPEEDDAPVQGKYDRGSIARHMGISEESLEQLELQEENNVY